MDKRRGTTVSLRELAGLRIAVVKQHPQSRDLMVEDLRWRGAEVVGLASGEALYRELAVRRCAIVVLDRDLPGEDGFSVARHLSQDEGLGIVILTGRGSATDMSNGLALGVDLYLVEPLDQEVLAAELHSLHRRLQQPAPEIDVEQTVTAPAQWQLTGDDWDLRAPNGKVLALTEAERAFLRALFNSPGTPVGREQLIAAIADDPWSFDPHRLEVLVHRLRRRIRSASSFTLPVRAVRGVGYRLTSRSLHNY